MNQMGFAPPPRQERLQWHFFWSAACSCVLADLGSQLRGDHSTALGPCLQCATIDVVYPSACRSIARHGQRSEKCGRDAIRHGKEAGVRAEDCGSDTCTTGRNEPVTVVASLVAALGSAPHEAGCASDERNAPDKHSELFKSQSPAARMMKPLGAQKGQSFPSKGI